MIEEIANRFKSDRKYQACLRGLKELSLPEDTGSPTTIKSSITKVLDI